MITRNHVFEFNISTWGWINLIVGGVVFFAAFGLFRGEIWARTVGIIVAIASAVVAFAWLPYVPFWSTLLIFVAVSVIWALSAHGQDLD